VAAALTSFLLVKSGQFVSAAATATTEDRKIAGEVVKPKRFIKISLLITPLLSVNPYQPLAELVNCRCSRPSLASGSGLGSPGRLDDLQVFTERFPSCFLHLFLLIPRLLGASPVSFPCLRCQLEFRCGS
jgi:hypothetical protein